MAGFSVVTTKRKKFLRNSRVGAREMPFLTIAICQLSIINHTKKEEIQLQITSIQC